MKDFIMALFTPMGPPKNYSVIARDFEKEYEESKANYEKKRNQPKDESWRSEKFEYNYVR